jgi:hypothetical protein
LTEARPFESIPVGVVVERRRPKSAWFDLIWRPTGIFGGTSGAKPWTVLSEEGDLALIYAGATEIELYRSETGNYRQNLESPMPSVWVILQPCGGEPPYKLAAVTVDPAEGEGLTEAGAAIVEMLPMPEAIREKVAAFVGRYHVEQVFEKRERVRADPEALARQGRRHRQTHG